VIVFFCLSCQAAAQDRPCLALDSDHILGRDLARALPEFTGMGSDIVLGAAPFAGAKRIFHSDEIGAFAARYAIKIESPRDVCFEWITEPLNRDSVLEAMRKSLGVPGARIEIAEMSLDRVPPGTIDFPREWLGKPASPDQPAPVSWRGNVTYGGNRRFAIWARVRINVPVDVITATETLNAGHPVRAEQLRIDRKDRFPAFHDSALTLQQIVGMLPLRSVPCGAEIRLSNLVLPNDVSRGDLVAIEVRSGKARLTFSARAESAGRTGDMIAVRNPESNKIFRARVCAKDKAIVETDLSWEN
jgi:flagella basal body P-ring formation protein FlgA